jgi:hypothetical protein
VIVVPKMVSVTGWSVATGGARPSVEAGKAAACAVPAKVAAAANAQVDASRLRRSIDVMCNILPFASPKVYQAGGVAALVISALRS